ncbi:diguanylate cyclase (GGDEF) domain-containing protein [Desulfosporosinus acidiphilus SJ4]|uniref:Diguanylate cyclase (GGDEF) domain-containing protein n=1 Tax=Desulfosporosinus acidiphilus (strain DSM 22704 / JCM 16185 / SJ4) TaxID=646529 RepID=I4D7E9_DESAJ|nr:diguanylate cyclase [Desulfosporosinus acidiphilus]AFM41723.1 diguanylate cyclase (GGDEF) domain-containing protein [Desulfosporosinus acidiphilus SJ4]
MTIKLSKVVAQKIVELIHVQSGFDVIVCDSTGTIIADSEKARIGQKHIGSCQILNSNRDYAVITAQEAEASNSHVKEGVNIAIEAEGVKIGTFGIAGPLEIVPPVARIAAGMIIMMLRDEELKDFIRNQVKVISSSVDQAANGEFNNIYELLKNTTENIANENDNCPEIYELIDRMSNLALKDTLTGTYNRRYINQKLPVDIISASLSEQSLSIIIADIDFFKKVNDSYGHVTGDHILKSFADILSGCIQRESDWISRFGGEEFLICLPGAGVEKAKEIAERMRSTIENEAIACGKHLIKITASFGVCSIKPSPRAPKINAEKLIECADHKLYIAKSNGRNRVES